MSEDVKVAAAPVSTRDIINQAVAGLGEAEGDDNATKTVVEDSGASGTVDTDAAAVDTGSVSESAARVGVDDTGGDAGKDGAVAGAADAGDAAAAGADKLANAGAAKPDADASADPHVNAALKELGIKAKDKNGKENRIPHSRTVRITENAVKRARAEWETKELTPLKTANTQMRTALDSIKSTEEMMFGTLDQKRQFLAQLANAVPGYADLLKETTVGAVPGAKAAAVDTDPEPEPDVKDDKGNPVGYSKEGHAKLREWDRRQAVKLAEESLGKKFKPLQDRFQTVEQREEQLRKLDSQIEEAQSWPGFTENATAILKVLEDDKTGAIKNLQQAYNTVLYGVATRKGEDETALTAKLKAAILKELQDAPRSTSAGGGGSQTTAERVAEASDGPRTTGDIIRDSIKNIR